MSFTEVSLVVILFVVIPTVCFSIRGVAISAVRISEAYAKKGEGCLLIASVVGHVFALLGWLILWCACVFGHWFLCRLVYVAIGGI
jgi:hypothetical protein